MTPYGATRPQWVNMLFRLKNKENMKVPYYWVMFPCCNIFMLSKNQLKQHAGVNFVGKKQTMHYRTMHYRTMYYSIEMAKKHCFTVMIVLLELAWMIMLIDTGFDWKAYCWLDNMWHQGWRLLSQVYVLFSLFFGIIDMLHLFIFDRCHCSYAGLTPVRYEHTLMNHI